MTSCARRGGDKSPDRQPTPKPAPVVANHSTTFPGPEELRAPSGPFVLRYFTRDDDDYNHELRLIDTRTDKPCWSLKFMRSADTLWAPSGVALAVTDWIGSNVSELTVVIPEESCPVVSLADEVIRSLGHSVLPESTNHEYFEASSWRDKTLLFRVWGDMGAEVREEFKKSFEYQFGGNVTEAQAQVN
jgi:hypothetical protein